MIRTKIKLAAGVVVMVMVMVAIGMSGEVAKVAGTARAPMVTDTTRPVTTQPATQHNATNPGWRPIKFGPTSELLLQDPSHDPAHCFLDFDTGRTFAPTHASQTDLEAGNPAALRWVQEAGLDLMVHSDGPMLASTYGLFVMGTDVDFERPHMWEMVRDKLLSAPRGSLGVINRETKLPAAWYFRTRDGGMGIFQLVSLDPGSGIKVRYKMLPTPATRPAATQPAKDAAP